MRRARKAGGDRADGAKRRHQAKQRVAQLVEAAQAAMAKLDERRFDEIDILAVYIDGIHRWGG